MPINPKLTLNKVIYESYWSPSQVKARSHPNMLATQSWMNQLYTADAKQKSNPTLQLIGNNTELS